MRRDAKFARDVILHCLPGHASAIVAASGYSAASVSRHLAALVSEGKAHQSGWTLAGKLVPVYSAGPPPEGFELPPKPDADLKRARAARTKRNRRARDEAYRLADNARRKRNRDRTYQPKPPLPAEERSRIGRAGALARWGDKAKKEAAFTRLLSQLTA